MAASGLNQSSRDKNADPKDHLYALMEFCIAVLETVSIFNEGNSLAVYFSIYVVIVIVLLV